MLTPTLPSLPPLPPPPPQLIKRSHKRREMDADFEEKRLNLSLGQAELDRENDYYTRPASPVLKVVHPHPGGYDPYDERQAIRHFRGGERSGDGERGLRSL